MYEAANRANVAVYPLDPRGMMTRRRETTTAQMMNFSVGDSDMLRTLAFETGARAIADRKDIRVELQRMTRDASVLSDRVRVAASRRREVPPLQSARDAAADDGVRARGLLVVQTRPERRWPGVARARRSGRRERGGESPCGFAAAERGRTDPGAEPRAHAAARSASAAGKPPLLAAPSVAVAQGRLVSAPVSPREFRRSDVVVARASVTGSPDISARLLNQFGQPLADLPAAISNGTCEVTVPLGSVAAGDYLVEMSATAGGEAARQFVAFRVPAR